MKQKGIILLLTVLLVCLSAAAARSEAGLAFSISDIVVTPGENVSIYYDLPKDGVMTIALMNEQNEIVLVLMNAHQETAGFHEAVWNGLGADGAPVREGSYTLRLTLDESHVDMAILIGASAQKGFTFGSPAATDPPQETLVLSPSAAPAPTAEPVPAAEPTKITPAFRSSHVPDHDPKGCYWCTPMNIEDEEAVWAMLTAPIYTVAENQRSQVIIREEPDDKSAGLGVVTGSSMGLHVLGYTQDGWALVECYSASFHDSRVKAWNEFVTGYIRKDQLVRKTPDQHFGIVIDKLTQTLYLFRDGHLFSKLAVSTGLYNSSQPYNETRSGEFLLVSKVGHFQSDAMICRFALRFDSGDLLHEVPHVLNADGGRNYKATEYKLGTRASHGCIRVQRLKNPEGVNMMWIYNNVSVDDSHGTKLVIWEDFAGRFIPVPGDDTELFYNAANGANYHSVADCPGVKEQYRPLTAFFYGELDQGKFAKLTPCPYCNPPLRKGEIEKINAAHETASPGMVSDYHQK